jgi:hypothetical protein
MNTTTRKTNRKCWNCNQPASHVMTREGSNTLHACDNCTRIDRAEAERLGWTIETIIRHRANQSETTVQKMAAKLSDEALCLAWMATEGQPVTQELAIVRGWIMDELNQRLGDGLFDEWLIATDDNGNGVNPIAFLATKGK